MKIANMHCETCKVICIDEREWLILLGYPMDGRRRNIAYCPKCIPQKFKGPEDFQWPLNKAKNMIDKIQNLWWLYLATDGMDRTIKERHLPTLAVIIEQWPDIPENRTARDLLQNIGDIFDVQTDNTAKTRGNLLPDYCFDTGAPRQTKGNAQHNLGLQLEDGKEGSESSSDVHSEPKE